MKLTEAVIEKEYIILDVVTDDEELKSFLFTLGCYSGEKITVMFTTKNEYIVSIKDSRYCIDRNLAECIEI